jgi:hypothetical protein
VELNDIFKNIRDRLIKAGRYEVVVSGRTHRDGYAAAFKVLAISGAERTVNELGYTANRGMNTSASTLPARHTMTFFLCFGQHFLLYLYLVLIAVTRPT